MHGVEILGVEDLAEIKSISTVGSFLIVPPKGIMGNNKD